MLKIQDLLLNNTIKQVGSIILLIMENILHHYHLIHLIEHHNEQENYHRSQQSKQTIRKIVKENESYEQAFFLALTDLMAQAYPGLKQLQWC